jgi:hypothetical protein
VHRELKALAIPTIRQTAAGWLAHSAAPLCWR